MRISDWSSDVCSSDLGRMRVLNFIDQPTWQAAVKQKLVIRQTRQQTDVSADYVAEMVRQALFEKYGESIYKIGRAACRERVCQYGEISVVAGSLKKKQK